MDGGELALVFAAGLGAGAVNSMAGGGTLLSFPAMIAVGVPALQANITNAVGMCPGYVGGAYAQRAHMPLSRRRRRTLAVVAGAGGIAGAIALFLTSESVFRAIVPYLILAACALLAFNDPVRRWVTRSHGADEGPADPDERLSVGLLAGVALTSVYGGYFGAGLGIAMLAILGVGLDDDLHRLNALKTVLSLVINACAAVFFIISGKVLWDFALVLGVSALIGGFAGGRVVRYVPPRVLRVVVIIFGVAVAVSLLVRG